MKKIFLISLVVLLFSCTIEKREYNGIKFNTYDDYVCYKMNEVLTPPIILMKKQGYVLSNDTVYSIMVKDANGKIDYFKLHSEVSAIIGSTYEINDTIRK